MQLEDDFGRGVTGIRVSVTDRCNFDCVYCHNEGLGDPRGPQAPGEDELSAEEIVRILEVVEGHGVESVKFTGGEPLLRKDLEEIVANTPDTMEISLTTNAAMLPGRAEGLAEAGLERVNVSLDAADPETFADVTQATPAAFDRVREGIDAAIAAGLTPVKLNTVVFERTLPAVPGLLEYVARREGIQLQLVEYMPEIAGNPEWRVDIDRVHDRLAERADRIERREIHGRRRYFLSPADGTDADSEGMVEVVDAVENPRFCSKCHRIRLTPDGKFRGCINRPDDVTAFDPSLRTDIRRTFKEVVHNRIPYYDEYMVEEDGEWVQNDRYEELSSSADG